MAKTNKTGNQPDKNITTPKSAPQPEPMTVERLEKEYPELVKQINNSMADFIAERTAEDIKREMPQLYARIAADAGGTSNANLNEKGFLLSQIDPFAEGTLRTFMHLTKQQGLRLPYVLPFKNKNSKAAISGYIIRAEGGGDIERAKKARAALEKCK